MPLVPTFSRQRQGELCEFKAGLFYKVSSRTTRAIQTNPVSKNNNNNNKEVPRISNVLLLLMASSVHVWKELL